MNVPENYTDDMLRGIYAVHANVAQGVADQGATAGVIMIKEIYDYITK